MRSVLKEQYSGMDTGSEIERDGLKVSTQFKTPFQQFWHEVVITQILLVTMGLENEKSI